MQKMSNKRKVERYFNRWVRPRSFKKGDLVLKQTKVTTQKEGKLRPCWEGPYVLTTCNRPGSY